MSSISLYDILGITKSASVEEVRKAYKRKALETHPDKLDLGTNEQGKLDAEAQFRKVHEAFEVLGDPQKRRAYDAQFNAKYRSSIPLSEDAKQRMKDREEWFKKHQEQHQIRMEAIKEERRRHEMAEKEMKVIAEMVKDITDSLNNAIPGWLERKQRVQQMRAERELKARGGGQMV
ncbi:Chaperone protein DnaJ [Hypsizygus marmoreus]|uniref:Chaperone protein DnaJ n=1 Tax=Hypsizygus marmoreus TaxID=39966 RepID=A0A369JY86_HYPMA|nr:Chaperone protein DnaJ [Hypsizygus marmoreus]